MTDDNISDFSALQKWNKISKEFRELLLANVFCSNCGVIWSSNPDMPFKTYTETSD